MRLANTMVGTARLSSGRGIIVGKIACVTGCSKVRAQALSSSST